MTDPRRYRGPIEERAWPEQLTGHVVTPGPRPRIHGYDVEGDLSLHYGFGETVLLALTGELPSRPVGRAFEVALQFAAPLAVGVGPAHASHLAGLCGADAPGVLAVGAIALGEEATAMVDGHRELLERLERGGGELPPRFATDDPAQQGAVGRLRDALGRTGVTVPLLEASPTRTAALLAVLHACGLGRREQLIAALVLARLPCVFAEGDAVHPGDLGSYPLELPPFVYRDPA
jgi:hypothetical protein